MIREPSDQTMPCDLVDAADAAEIKRTGWCVLWLRQDIEAWTRRKGER